MKPLCKCGCGKEVIHSTATWLRGHAPITKETKEKIKQTCLLKYGVSSTNKLQSMKEKSKQTCLEKYGVEYASQLKENRDGFKKTCLEKYGVENPLQTEKFKEKSKVTCLKKYGVGNPFQSRKIKDKIEDTCLIKYGVKYYAQSKESRLCSRETMIRTIMKNYKDGSKFSPTKGKQESIILDELENLCNFIILRDETFIGYFPDGYIKDLNLIVEIYEPWHRETCWLQHDQRRLFELSEHLNCKYFIVYQDEWNNNKEKIKEDFLSFILKIEK